MKTIAFGSLLLLSRLFATTVAQPCPSMQQFEEGTGCVEVPEIDTCGTLPIPQQLVTQPIAEFMTSQSTLVNNVFTFKINSPATQGRIIEAIEIESPVNLGDPEPYCSYPSSTNYTRSYELAPCADTFTGTFSFQELISCGLAKTASNSTHDQYSAYVTLTGSDQIGKLRTLDVQRTTTSRLKVDFTLPTLRALSLTGLQVISPISLQSAVIGQSFDPITRVATIKILTSVQYPYYLTFATGRTAPAGLVPTYSITQPECPSGSPCNQEITMNIATSGPTCDFSGNYETTVSYECNEIFSDCPLVPGATSLISFTLNSGNACPTLSIDSQVSGVMIASASDTFVPTTSVFAAGQTGHFRITLTSGVNIQSIAVSGLRVNGKTINDGDFDYTGGEVSPTVYEFSLSLTVGIEGSGSLFQFQQQDNFDDVFTFNVEADVAITYVTSLKRDVQQESHRISQKFYLDKTAVAQSIISSLPEESSSPAIIPAAATLVAGMILANF